MFQSEDKIHLSLSELIYICSLVSIFDKTVSDRIDKVYTYHKFVLKENDNSRLSFSIPIENNYVKKFHGSSCFQPEFIFDEDYEIF